MLSRRGNPEFRTFLGLLNPEFALGRGRRQKISGGERFARTLSSFRMGQFFPELLNRTAASTLSSLGTKLSSSFFVFGLTPNAKSGFKGLGREDK